MNTPRGRCAHVQDVGCTCDEYVASLDEARSQTSTTTDIHKVSDERREPSWEQIDRLRDNWSKAQSVIVELERDLDAAERAVEKYKKETATAWTRIAELEAALRKIAPSQRGLDMNADDAEQADYWSRLVFYYRSIATVALAQAPDGAISPAGYCTHGVNHSGERHGCDGCCPRSARYQATASPATGTKCQRCNDWGWYSVPGGIQVRCLHRDDSLDTHPGEKK